MSFMSNQTGFHARSATAIPQRPRLFRPAPLIAAARAGASGWKGARDLPRALKSAVPPSPAAVLTALYDIEAELDLARRDRQASYDLQRHILALIGILAESAAAEAALGPSALGTMSRARP